MGVFSDGKTKLTVSAETEQEHITNTVAQYPVQDGEPIVDHTQRESKSWDFEGKLYGKDLKECDAAFKVLLDWQYHGNLLTYIGAIQHGNLIITDLEKTYEEGGFTNAIKFTMTLTYVTISKSSFTAATHVGAKAPTPAKKPGKYVTVKAGNTYWGWWQQYGTPIQTLRNWNKWPDRRIPIGAKARVA